MSMFTKITYVYKRCFMQEVISIRPTEEIEEKIEKLAKLEHMEKSTLVRKLLLKGADEELKKQALEMFRENKVSAGRAAEIAGISIYEMLDLIKQKGFALHITKQDIEEDFKYAKASKL